MLLRAFDAMHAAPDADGSGGLDYGEFQQGIRKLPGGCIHMTEDDFDLITEWGKHLGVTGEFDVRQFREMMKGELWRFSRRQLKNVLAESTNNEFKSIVLMLKLMEIRQMAHTTAQVCERRQALLLLCVHAHMHVHTHTHTHTHTHMHTHTHTHTHTDTQTHRHTLPGG